MQVTELSGELDTARTDNAELSAKLTRLAEEQRAERGQLRELGSALEIARVQLIQLRGAGQTVGGNSGQQQEIQNLNAELQATRKSLAEALGTTCSCSSLLKVALCYKDKTGKLQYTVRYGYGADGV